MTSCDIKHDNCCSQKVCAEHEGYTKTSRLCNRVGKKQCTDENFGSNTYKDNFNRAYKKLRQIRKRLESME